MNCTLLLHYYHQSIYKMNNPYSNQHLSYTITGQESVSFPTLQYLPSSDPQGNTQLKPSECGARCPVCRWTIQGRQVVLHRGCATYFCIPCYNEKRNMFAVYDSGDKKGKQFVRCPACKNDLSLREPDLGIPNSEFMYTGLLPPSPTAPAGPRTPSTCPDQGPTQAFVHVIPLWQGQPAEQQQHSEPSHGIKRRSEDSHYEQVEQAPMCYSGANCRRKNCRFTHPGQVQQQGQQQQLGPQQQQGQQYQQGQPQQQGPQQQQQGQQQQQQQPPQRQAPNCRNGINCKTNNCRFSHPLAAPMCRFAEKCKFKNTCKRSHPGQLEPLQQQQQQQGGQQGGQQRGGGGGGQQQQQGQQQRGRQPQHQQQRGGQSQPQQLQLQPQGGGQQQQQGPTNSQRPHVSEVSDEYDGE